MFPLKGPVLFASVGPKIATAGTLSAVAICIGPASFAKNKLASLNIAINCFNVSLPVRFTIFFVLERDIISSSRPFSLAPPSLPPISIMVTS